MYTLKGALIFLTALVPANRKHWTNAGAMLLQHLRCWPNTEPSLCQCLVSAGVVDLSQWTQNTYVGPRNFYIKFLARGSWLDQRQRCWAGVEKMLQKYVAFTSSLGCDQCQLLMLDQRRSPRTNANQTLHWVIPQLNTGVLSIIYSLQYGSGSLPQSAWSVCIQHARSGHTL